jgi:hypothetical protein
VLRLKGGTIGGQHPEAPGRGGRGSGGRSAFVQGHGGGVGRQLGAGAARQFGGRVAVVEQQVVRTRREAIARLARVEDAHVLAGSPQGQRRTQARVRAANDQNIRRKSH